MKQVRSLRLLYYIELHDPYGNLQVLLQSLKTKATDVHAYIREITVAEFRALHSLHSLV